VLSLEKTSQAPSRTVRFNRLPSLTGLRFVAAFVVFGFHATISPPFTAAPTDAGLTGLAYLFRQGATGVSLFFVLSGFVLTWSARPRQAAYRFLRRRAAKIYPNHLVTAVAALATLASVGLAPSVLAVASNLLLVQAWVPLPSVFFGLNTPSWSLSCEAAFYLSFPLLLPVLRRLGDRWLWPATVAVLGVVVALPAVALALPDRFDYWFVYVFPPSRMLEFVAGILLARILRAGRWIPLPVLPAAGLAVAAYVGSGYLPGAFAYVAGTVVPFALLIPAVAAADLAGARSWLRSRVMMRLGELSFAFYLVHQLIIRLVEKVFPHRAWPPVVRIGLVLVMLAASLVAAWMMHASFEVPVIKAMRKRVRRGIHRRPAGTLPSTRRYIGRHPVPTRLLAAGVRDSGEDATAEHEVELAGLHPVA
jgi:peptidoglycan/LPS O-acetylase OafA/YrhL